MEENISERKIETGLWVQTIGQIIETLSVSKQVSLSDNRSILNAQRMVILGDLLQSAGAATEAKGGIEILSEGTESLSLKI